VSSRELLCVKRQRCEALNSGVDLVVEVASSPTLDIVGRGDANRIATRVERKLRRQLGGNLI
jgi:hypothetical protein